MDRDQYRLSAGVLSAAKHDLQKIGLPQSAACIGHICKRDMEEFLSPIS
jgi:hypothetical protein